MRTFEVTEMRKDVVGVIMMPFQKELSGHARSTAMHVLFFGGGIVGTLAVALLAVGAVKIVYEFTKYLF